MTPPRIEPTVRVISDRPSDISTELLVVPVAVGDDLSDLPELDAATGGQIADARNRGEFKPDPGELFVTPLNAEWRPSRVALVGVGAAADQSSGRLRTAFATMAVAARRRRVRHIAVMIRPTEWGLPLAETCQAVVEGALFGGFEDRRYKTDHSGASDTPLLESCHLCVESAHTERATRAADKGAVIGASANLARELANDPANTLGPVAFAEQSASLVREYGVGVSILGEDEIRELGMGLILGVSQGSPQPAQLLVMEYTPDAPQAGPVLGLVGKGVTFDSGGISIKPNDGMARMKHDMAGGAAVVGAMGAIGQLRPPVRCLGVVPMVENMPGGRATRPGDVLTSAAGTTVEVLNTDAEGRLILADALWYARKQGATHLVDVATLTGSCVVALGNAASGLFGTPDPWVESVRAAGARTGERLWPLPLYDEYREQLKSETADLANVGGRPAGASTAASFLQAFTGDLPWAHLDIAGTAWAEKTGRDHAKGATGVMVRTLTELACSDVGGWVKMEG